MPEALIVDAVRSPIGRGRPTGALHDVHPVDLLAHSLRALADRTELDPAVLDDVIGGTVTQAGDQALNLTRSAVLAAGFPESVPATTVDRQCGSSLQALHFAAQGVQAGAYQVAIAAGVESMGRVPMGSAVLPGSNPFGPTLAERYPEGLVPQGISAELIAARWDIGRTEMDEFSLASHQKAAAAAKDGAFDAELAPIAGLDRDEGVRLDTSLAALAALRPAYHDAAMAARFPQLRWQVTAGNTSQISDGSAAVLVASPDAARRYGLRPLARVHSAAVAADDPLYMLTAIVPATEKVLHRAGLRLDDIDLFEVNEAFASVVLAWARRTGADPNRVNVNGGAIALGHPLGATGARITSTLVHALHQRGARYGLQVICEAGGQANATILERLTG
ncbi:acetyl-CoA acetyltransferase [Actinocatenispora thailandica]|uniref:Acetyl-CoA acetyltransferase n=1 Tax=Actinocatenispora thailandica TaxID=227318 RepID=A0A7R7HV93_9ACTN|nr:acetyl-CoA C-acyltransferase [Actinocatenispora thailandica]BCJ33498.1 acetyl-CoA acetyltransferase [Actinocatenispora thailandica]